MKPAVFVLATLTAGVAVLTALAADRQADVVVAQALRDRGEGDLVQGNRWQRALPYLRIPAARGHPGRLVPRPSLRPARRSIRRLRPDQRPRLLHSRVRGLSGEEPGRDLRLRLVPGRRRAAHVRRPGGLP